MSYFIITKERLLYYLRVISNGERPGVYDWFVDDEMVLNICLSVNGVKYIYREFESTVDAVIRTYLSSDSMVLGVYEREEEPELEEVTINDFVKLGDLSAN